MPVGAGGEIAEAQAPTDGERQFLATRLDGLRAAMISAERPVIQTLVGSLLAGYPVGRGHRDDVDAVMRMFVQSLSGLPGWAISAACSAWNRGEAGGKNTSFAPAPPDLRDLALKACLEFQREQHMIGSILRAEVIPERESDETREAVVARVRSFAATIGEPEKPAPVEPAEDFDAWEARTKAGLRAAALTLSTEAIRALSPMLTDAEVEALRNPPQKTDRAA